MLRRGTESHCLSHVLANRETCVAQGESSLEHRACKNALYCGTQSPFRALVTQPVDLVSSEPEHLMQTGGNQRKSAQTGRQSVCVPCFISEAQVLDLHFNYSLSQTSIITQAVIVCTQFQTEGAILDLGWIPPPKTSRLHGHTWSVCEKRKIQWLGGGGDLLCRVCYS